MLPTVIKTCPSAENDFEPLSEYQAQTPETFFDGKPVLYFHDEHVKAWCSTEHYKRLYFFSGDDSATKHPTAPENQALENDGGKHMREEAQVQVFVGSSKFILFSPSSGTGIEIPYPAITLHAIKNFRSLQSPDNADLKFVGVYMQLEFSGDGGGDDDDSFDPIELTLIPSQSPQNMSDSRVDPLNAERNAALFNQISACSNLHPDPQDEDDDDEEDEADRIIFEGEALEGLPGAFQGDASGGLPPPMPGSSGWITAENVNEYFDAEGNWIGGGGDEAEEGISGELGEGAGRVRVRDEVDGEGANGHSNEDAADSKRPRTE
ncbi:uncharacterized protein PG986_000638 [Apiospora aurea]|uniref:Regulator of volume decrease after cellular swelling-domain-containing protein n=1 Tax=Apiospora aurea TaxID=335848 RepID=A0ABR1QVL7_9PEZI